MANRKTRVKYNPQTQKLPGTNLALLARALQLIARREARLKQQAESQPCAGLTFTNSNNLWSQSGTTSGASSTTSEENSSSKSSSSNTSNATASRSSSELPSNPKKRKASPSIYQQEIARKRRERLLRETPQPSLNTTPADTRPSTPSPLLLSPTNSNYNYNMEGWVAGEAKRAKVGSQERHDAYHGTTSPTTELELPNLHTKRKISAVDDEPPYAPEKENKEPLPPPSKKQKTKGKTNGVAPAPITTRPRAGKTLSRFVLTQEQIEKEKADCHFCQLESFSTHTDYPITVENNQHNGATFPDDFRFIEKPIFGTGVARCDPNFRAGCECTSSKGCLTNECACHNPDDARSMPYHTTGEKKGHLKTNKFNSPLAIFECHDACLNCKDGCPKRVVDAGRKLPLTIFRTSDGRGWGVKSSVPVKAGQFIDKYIGEILTSKSTNHRRQNADRAERKDVYLFALDKFEGEEALDGGEREIYEVDGEFFGGPTRFINHSCDPNLRIFARIGDESDKHIHDLAFFAIKNIDVGEEFTFDYVDGKHEEAIFDGLDEDEVKEKQKDMAPCLCGKQNCRGWLW